MKSLSLMSVRRVVRSSRSAAFNWPWLSEKSFFSGFSASVFFAKTRLSGHFPDVGGGEVNTVVEAVLQPSQFDPLGINGGNNLIQLFLGCDHDPARSNYLALLEQALADLAELFNGRPQVFDLVAATSDVLAYFVDDEHEGFTLSAASPEVERAVDHLPDRHRCVSIALGVRPRIRRRIEFRIKLVQNGARTGQLLRPGPDCFPVFVQQGLTGGDELRQFAFGFEFDF